MGAADKRADFGVVIGESKQLQHRVSSAPALARWGSGDCTPLLVAAPGQTAQVSAWQLSIECQKWRDQRQLNALWLTSVPRALKRPSSDPFVIGTEVFSRILELGGSRHVRAIRRQRGGAGSAENSVAASGFQVVMLLQPVCAPRKEVRSNCTELLMIYRKEAAFRAPSGVVNSVDL